MRPRNRGSRYAPPPAASETLTSFDSAQANESIGHPGQGMSSAEKHHEGMAHREKAGYGGGEQWGDKRGEALKSGEGERGHHINLEGGVKGD